MHLHFGIRMADGPPPGYVEGQKGFLFFFLSFLFKCKSLVIVKTDFGLYLTLCVFFFFLFHFH